MTDDLQYIATIDTNIQALIDWMAGQSQSLTLNYGEDTGAWECSWIVAGQRHTAVSYGLLIAVREALRSAGLVLQATEDGRIDICRRIHEVTA